MTTSPRGVLVDASIEALFGGAISVGPGAPAIDASRQLQPASLDVRLGARAHLLRSGFLPEHVSIEQRLAQLGMETVELGGEGLLLQRGQIWLFEIEEQLALPDDLTVRFNPRSSTGRLDLFCRVLTPGHPRFDECPAGYSGRVWLEVVPLSFPVRVRRGDRLAQLRVQRGDPALTRDELRETYERTPLCFLGDVPVRADEVRFDEQGALELRVGLDGRDPCGWRAALNTPPVEFAGDGTHDARAYFEPVVKDEDEGCVLDPGRFYIFASRERLRIPPDLCAEMLPVDVGFGELRNNYAGFFDNGFGWSEDASGRPVGNGTPAVLEVRAHDVPFLVEDGQIFFRLRYFRTAGRPRSLYGQGRSGGSSYQAQDLTLARPFRQPHRG
ncbi:MAG: 2'-deoxycytidine 5'-triphosphate deaminase [Planctomycetota bacterium]